MGRRVRLAINVAVLLAGPGIAMTLRGQFAPGTGFVGFLFSAIGVSAGLARWLWSVTSPEVKRAAVMQQHQQRKGLPVTKPKPITRLLLYSFHGAFVAFAGLTVIGLVIPSARPQVWPDSTLAVRLVGTAVICYLGLATLLLRVKDSAKKSKLDRIANVLPIVNEYHSLAPAHRGASNVAGTGEAVSRLLKELLATVDQDPRLATRFYPRKVPRTAWILLPNSSERNFRSVHVCNGHDAYRAVAKHHKPALIDQKCVERLDDEYNKKEEELRSAAFQKYLTDVYFPKLWNCGSLTGYAFSNPGPWAYARVSHCPFFDDTYVDHLPASDRSRFIFRSCAGIRLQLDDSPLGVLMLYDTLPFGFGEKDTAPLKIYGSLLSSWVAQGLSEGMYQNTDHVHYC